MVRKLIFFRASQISVVKAWACPATPQCFVPLERPLGRPLGTPSADHGEDRPRPASCHAAGEVGHSPRPARGLHAPGLRRLEPRGSRLHARREAAADDLRADDSREERARRAAILLVSGEDVERCPMAAQRRSCLSKSQRHGLPKAKIRRGSVSLEERSNGVLGYCGFRPRISTPAHPQGRPRIGPKLTSIRLRIDPKATSKRPPIDKSHRRRRPLGFRRHGLRRSHGLWRSHGLGRHRESRQRRRSHDLQRPLGLQLFHEPRRSSRRTRRSN